MVIIVVLSDVVSDGKSGIEMSVNEKLFALLRESLLLCF